MTRKTAPPQAYVLGALTIATVFVTMARGLIATRQPEALTTPAPAPSRETARRRPMAIPMRLSFASIAYARSADLMGYALMMTGLSLVFVAVVHGSGFLLPVGLAWCVAALAIAQLRNAFGSAGALGFGMAGLLGGADAFSFGAGHFTSVADFAPAMFSLVGSVAAVVFASLDLADRGGITIGRWTSHGAVALIAAATLAVAATGASGVATIAARDGVSAADREGAQSISMRDVRFVPEMLRATSGETVRLVIANDDLIVHTFTLEAAAVDAEIGAGSEQLIEFVAPAPGRYTFICTVPGHEAMTGGLTVD